jgi:hypothetical protein
MELGKLIPQVFFDLLARSVPGTVVLGSWIVLLGRDRWSDLLNALLGGYLDSSNVVAIATLTFFFLSFLVGHILAPFAKGVQRLNERTLVDKDPCAGKRYDWLRAHHGDAGALCAKIRAEFLMYDALSIAFLVVAAMAILTSAVPLAIAAVLAVPLMAYRGAETARTYQKTVGQFHDAYGGPICKAEGQAATGNETNPAANSAA